MAKLVYGLWLLCALVIQVNSIEIVNGFDNTTETESEEDYRFLFNGLANKCRAKLQTTSTVLPTTPVALTRLINNRLYFFSPVASTATFDNAAKFCRDHGMNLVTINSQRENELVFSEAVSRGLAGAAPGTGAWIGLRDATAGAFMFRWILNGKPNTFNFFNVPPATAGTCVQYITATASTAANSWAEIACTSARPFICELEPPCGLIL